MNDTLKSILGILEEGTPELQIAAIQVLGELAPQDAAVAEALEQVLVEAGDRVFGRYVLDALGKLRSPAAIQVLVHRIQAGGQFGEQIDTMLASMGVETHHALAGVFDSADPDTRHRILRIFGHQPGKEALGVLKQAIVDPALSQTAGDALRGAAEELPEAGRKGLGQDLVKILGDKKVEHDPEVEAEMLRCIGAIDGHTHRAVLARYWTDKHPATVRRAAVHAARGLDLTPTQLRGLLEMLQRDEDRDLHRDLVEVLGDVAEWSKESGPALMALVQERDRDRRLLGLRAMALIPGDESAKLAYKFLHHDDAPLREAAVAALSGNPKALEPLMRSILNEREAVRAEIAAGVLTSHAERITGKHYKSLLDKACRCIVGGDELGDVLLGLALEVDFNKTVDEVVDKSVRLRRARKFEDAVLLLARIVRLDAPPPEAHYQMAVARLLLEGDQAGEGAPAFEAGDPTMGEFALLVRQGFPVMERLKKETMLKPPELLRIGRHFAGSVGAEQELGAGMLQILAGKTGQNPAIEEAKLLLRSVGG